MPHIPTFAVAPRLGGEPLDRVEPVERLVRRVLVERDAARRPGARARRPGTARTRERANHCPARDVRRCGASCPCRTGSSRGSPGTGPGAIPVGDRQPDVGGQLARRRGRGSARRARRLDREAGALRASGRRLGHGPSLGGRTGAPDAGARAVRRCRRWRAEFDPARARRVAYENPWITVWHDEVHPAGRQPRDLRRRALREPRRRRRRPR